MLGLKKWLKAIRVPFSTATIIPIVLGAVIAWSDTGVFLWFRFWLTLIAGLLIHFATNMSNDYFDHLSGADVVNPTPTPFSGGSRVIQEGLIPAKKIFYASLIAFALGAGIGLYLNIVCGGNVILIFGLIGIPLAFFYTAKPLRLGYGTFGEIAVGTGFGPLMVMGSYYVQAQSLTLRAFLASLPVGILVTLILYINEFPDYVGDKEVGKRNLVVVLGKKRAVILYHILLASVYLVILLLIALKFLPIISLIVFLSLPLALKAYAVSRKNYDKVFELLPANAATIGLHSLIGILLVLSFVFEKILRRG